jgi:hypothetical protein
MIFMKWRTFSPKVNLLKAELSHHLGDVLTVILFHFMKLLRLT